jgi:hypothetical protein
MSLTLLENEAVRRDILDYARFIFSDHNLTWDALLSCLECPARHVPDVWSEHWEELPVEARLVAVLAAQEVANAQLLYDE